MKLFKITRYGNPESPDKSSGEDTHFLVRAVNYLEAVELVDRELETLPHDGVADFSNVAVEIGDDLGTSESARIILGPVVQWSWSSEYPKWWKREEKNDQWIPYEGSPI